MLKRFIPILILIAAAAFSACSAATPNAQPTQEPGTQAPEATVETPTEAPTAEPQAMDYAAFVSALKADGWPVEEIGPASGSLFTGNGHRLQINGVEVQAFEYADHAALEAQAALISKDGSQVGSQNGVAMVDWVDMPHFFKSGRVLAVYTGRADGTLSALKHVMGEEFAGGTIEAWGPGTVTPIPPGDSGGLGGLTTDDLAKALQDAGATVKRGETIPQDLFSVSGQVLKVNGQNMDVYQYDTAEAAADDAAKITAGGSMIGERAVDFFGPPNYYHTGRLIVLYVGTDAGITGLLEKILGKPMSWN